MANDPKDQSDSIKEKPVESSEKRTPKLTGERLVCAKEVQRAEQSKSNPRLKSAADLMSIKPGETLEQYKARVSEAEKTQPKNPLVLFDSQKGVAYTADGVEQLSSSESAAKGNQKAHADTRTVEQKAGDFFNAAMRRATNFFNDSTQQKAYFSGLQDKVAGIGEGLNEAKEEVKKLAGDGFNASIGASDEALKAMARDPRAAEKAIHELSNHIRETVSDMAGQAIEAMARDPHAFDKVMNQAFEHLKEASEKYSHMTPREQGKVIGKFMFTMVNPGGSLEAPQLAAQATMRGAGAVDKHAPEIFASLKNLRTAAPEMAERAEQWLNSHMPGWKKTEAVMASASRKVEQPHGTHRDQVKTVERHEGHGESRELPPKTFEQFVTELQNEVRSLPKKQLEFLDKPGKFPERRIEVEPIKRIRDRFPQVDERTGGCYDPKTHKIYVAQEVWSPSMGKFVPNDDVRFALQHEIGHAFNDNADLEGYLSTKLKEFRTAYAKDKQAIIAKDTAAAQRRAAGHRIQGEDEVGVWDKLGLHNKEAISMEAAWDEAFADLFAHSQGLTSKNPWSQMMKENFPNSLEFMKRMGYLR